MVTMDLKSYVSLKLSNVTSYYIGSNTSDTTDNSKYEKSVRFSKCVEVIEIPSRKELKHLRLWYSNYEIDIMKRQARNKKIQLHIALDSLKRHNSGSEFVGCHKNVENSNVDIDKYESAENKNKFFQIHTFPAVTKWSKSVEFVNLPVPSSSSKFDLLNLPKIMNSVKDSSSFQTPICTQNENDESMNTVENSDVGIDEYESTENSNKLFHRNSFCNLPLLSSSNFGRLSKFT